MPLSHSPLFAAGAGCINVAYAHMTRLSTRRADRDRRMTWYYWACRVGQMVAPAVGMIGASDTLLPPIDASVFTANAYTIPSFCMLLAFAASLLLQFAYAYRTRDEPNTPSLSHALTIDSQLDGDFSDAVLVVRPGSFSREALVLLLAYFGHLFAYWSFNAAVIPFLSDVYHYPLHSAYVFFLYMGVALAVSFGFFMFLQERVKKLMLVNISLGASCIGMVGLFKMTSDEIPKGQLDAAAALIVFGYCIGTCHSRLLTAIFALLKLVTY
jgi:Na+/melibiose symporter-like transporter